MTDRNCQTQLLDSSQLMFPVCSSYWTWTQQKIITRKYKSFGCLGCLDDCHHQWWKITFTQVLQYVYELLTVPPERDFRSKLLFNNCLGLKEVKRSNISQKSEKLEKSPKLENRFMLQNFIFSFSTPINHLTTLRIYFVTFWRGPTPGARPLGWENLDWTTWLFIKLTTSTSHSRKVQLTHQCMSEFSSFTCWTWRFGVRKTFSLSW